MLTNDVFPLFRSGDAEHSCSVSIGQCVGFWRCDGCGRGHHALVQGQKIPVTSVCGRPRGGAPAQWNSRGAVQRQAAKCRTALCNTIVPDWKCPIAPSRGQGKGSGISEVQCGVDPGFTSVKAESVAVIAPAHTRQGVGRSLGPGVWSSGAQGRRHSGLGGHRNMGPGFGSTATSRTAEQEPRLSPEHGPGRWFDGSLKFGGCWEPGLVGDQLDKPGHSGGFSRVSASKQSYCSVL